MAPSGMDGVSANHKGEKRKSRGGGGLEGQGTTTLLLFLPPPLPFQLRPLRVPLFCVSSQAHVFFFPFFGVLCCGLVLFRFSLFFRGTWGATLFV